MRDTANSLDPVAQPAWRALTDHARRLSGVSLRDLLDTRGRFESCSASGAGLLFDYSRQRVDEAAMHALTDLADQCGLPQQIESMWRGDEIDSTERRPALHIALRRDPGEPLYVGGENIMDAVASERQRMLRLVEAIHCQEITGSTGKPFRHLINIGIGGSDLGLVMAMEALRNERNHALTVHFVSNVDGQQLDDALAAADIEETLIVICSKSFTTQETRLNAEAARRWVADRLGEPAVPDHFMAVSVNSGAMDSFGVHPERRFRIWDWVGGRYSMWSSIGLAIAAGTSGATFEALLAGAAAMDEHFRLAPPDENLPVLAGLLGIWNQNFLGAESHVVLPYDQRLHRFPAFLQQLEMESNGKAVTRAGEPVCWKTGGIVWGEPGSNAQHSFFQLLHQGTATFSADFIASAKPGGSSREQHLEALANMLAQAEGFARGRGLDEVLSEPEADPAIAVHRVHQGDRPSTIILCRELSPFSLGALVALYEHKVFVQSTVWGINAFDQWGVELGKKLAGGMRDILGGVESPEGAPGIAAVIRDWR